jgi:hypothetical protein
MAVGDGVKRTRVNNFWHLQLLSLYRYLAHNSSASDVSRRAKRN